MHDPMLEEIWRVRDELIQRHGGVHGYLNYLRELDRKRVSDATHRRQVLTGKRASTNARSRRMKTAKV